MTALLNELEAQNSDTSKPANENFTVPKGPWNVSIHKDHKELEAVWRELETDGHCTVFQTYDWVSCWYDTTSAYGEAEPLILLVSDESGASIWILPLCISTKKGLRTISFADLGLCDFAAPVMARNAPSGHGPIKDILRAVMKALPSCDVIHFPKLAEKVDGLPNPLLRLRGYQPFPALCHGIPMREPWPELREKIMQSRLRSTIRAKSRKIKKKGEVVIEHHSTPETIKPVMDELMEMREARFSDIGRSEMPLMWRSFYYDLATRDTQSIRASISTMRVDGETIASCFGLYRGDTYCAIIPTFQIGEWASFRPGMLLFDAMLTDLGERMEKEAYFDFSVGDQNFKSRFGSETRLLYDWMAPRSITGIAAYLFWRAKIILRRYPKAFTALKTLKGRITEIKGQLPKAASTD